MIKSWTSFHFAMSLLGLLAMCQEGWNYNVGGMDWPNESNSCGGSSQSPIALAQNQLSEHDNPLVDITFNSLPVNTTFSLQHSLMLKGAFSTLTMKDSNGTLLEFEGANLHFHAPGEHFINDRLHDAELHIVHKLKPEFLNSTKFRYAVVGILFDAKENEKSSFLEELKLDVINEPMNFHMQETLWEEFSKLETYFHYQGSLTTPPCDEAAYWFVFTSPLVISPMQLTIIDNYFRGNPQFANGRGNNRVIQKLNSRTVVYGTYKQRIVSNLEESRFFDIFLETIYK